MNPYNIKETLFILITTLCIGYIAFCLFMYQQQDTLLYQPKLEKVQPQDVGAEGAIIVRVTTEDGITLEGWYFPPASGNSKTIVFFHGNGGVIGDVFPRRKRFLDNGFGLLMVEYRGYAGHAGRVSEQGLYKDSRAFIDWLHEQTGAPYEDMIFYGESLGGALAVQMAAEYNPYALILFGTFSSMLDMAGEYYPYIPVSLLLKDRYPSDKTIRKVTCPVLVLHGKKDTLINYSYGQKLFDAANDPKELIMYEQGDHANLYTLGAHDAIREFLGRVENNTQTSPI